MGDNMQQRLYALLQQRSGMTTRQIARELHVDKDSARWSLADLREKGIVDAVETDGAMLYFVVRNAERPTERRGTYARNKQHVGATEN